MPNPHTPAHTHNTQRLLKEKLELENVKGRDGRPRVTLKPIEDELTFDKVQGAVRTAALLWCGASCSCL